MLVTGRLAALLLALLMGGSTWADADICVGVDVRFSDRIPSQVLLRSIQDEVSSIWQPYGVRVESWTDQVETGCGPMEASFDVSVERSHSPLAARLGGVVLGTTRLQDGVIDHVPIRIDFDATEQTLAGLLTDPMAAFAGHPPIKSVDIGRALGRILAHEIGHVLLAAPGHQSHGLMRPSFGAKDLVALKRESFTLSSAELERLRQRRQIWMTARQQMRPGPATPVPGNEGLTEHPAATKYSATGMDTLLKAPILTEFEFGRLRDPSDGRHPHNAAAAVASTLTGSPLHPTISKTSRAMKARAS